MSEGLRLTQNVCGHGEPNLPRVSYLKAGERVLITDGCFADVEAIFVTNDGEQRVMLLMNILHREQTVSFPVTSVRKVRA
jgi:transcription antitermination factor NusG